MANPNHPQYSDHYLLPPTDMRFSSDSTNASENNSSFHTKMVILSNLNDTKKYNSSSMDATKRTSESHLTQSENYRLKSLKNNNSLSFSMEQMINKYNAEHVKKFGKTSRVNQSSKQRKIHKQVKADNHRMTGNVNIYICSEANENVNGNGRKIRSRRQRQQSQDSTSSSATETEISSTCSSRDVGNNCNTSLNKLISCLLRKQKESQNTTLKNLHDKSQNTSKYGVDKRQRESSKELNCHNTSNLPLMLNHDKGAIYNSDPENFNSKDVKLTPTNKDELYYNPIINSSGNESADNSTIFTTSKTKFVTPKSNEDNASFKGSNRSFKESDRSYTIQDSRLDDDDVRVYETYSSEKDNDMNLEFERLQLFCRDDDCSYLRDDVIGLYESYNDIENNDRFCTIQNCPFLESDPAEYNRYNDNKFNKENKNLGTSGRFCTINDCPCGNVAYDKYSMYNNELDYIDRGKSRDYDERSDEKIYSKDVPEHHIIDEDREEMEYNNWKQQDSINEKTERTYKNTATSQRKNRYQRYNRCSCIPEVDEAHFPDIKRSFQENEVNVETLFVEEDPKVRKYGEKNENIKPSAEQFIPAEKETNSETSTFEKPVLSSPINNSVLTVVNKERSLEKNDAELEINQSSKSPLPAQIVDDVQLLQNGMSKIEPQPVPSLSTVKPDNSQHSVIIFLTEKRVDSRSKSFELPLEREEKQENLILLQSTIETDRVKEDLAGEITDSITRNGQSFDKPNKKDSSDDANVEKKKIAGVNVKERNEMSKVQNVNFTKSRVEQCGSKWLFGEKQICKHKKCHATCTNIKVYKSFTKVKNLSSGDEQTRKRSLDYKDIQNVTGSLPVETKVSKKNICKHKKCHSACTNRKGNKCLMNVKNLSSGDEQTRKCSLDYRNIQNVTGSLPVETKVSKKNICKHKKCHPTCTNRKGNKCLTNVKNLSSGDEQTRKCSLDYKNIQNVTGSLPVETKVSKKNICKHKKCHPACTNRKGNKCLTKVKNLSLESEQIQKCSLDYKDINNRTGLLPMETKVFENVKSEEVNHKLKERNIRSSTERSFNSKLRNKIISKRISTLSVENIVNDDQLLQRNQQISINNDNPKDIKKSAESNKLEDPKIPSESKDLEDSEIPTGSENLKNQKVLMESEDLNGLRIPIEQKDLKDPEISIESKDFEDLQILTKPNVLKDLKVSGESKNLEDPKISSDLNVSNVHNIEKSAESNDLRDFKVLTHSNDLVHLKNVNDSEINTSVRTNSDKYTNTRLEHQNRNEFQSGSKQNFERDNFVPRNAPSNYPKDYVQSKKIQNHEVAIQHSTKCHNNCYEEIDENLPNDIDDLFKSRGRCCYWYYENNKRKNHTAQEFPSNIVTSQIENKYDYNINNEEWKPMICLYCDNSQSQCVCKYKTSIKQCFCCNLSVDTCSCQKRQFRNNNDATVHKYNGSSAQVKEIGDRMIRITSWKQRRSIKRSYRSNELPYQQMSIFSNVINELQQKMKESECCKNVPCCCYLARKKREGHFRPNCETIQRTTEITKETENSEYQDASILPKNFKSYLNPWSHEQRKYSPPRVCNKCKTTPCRCRKSRSTQRRPRAKCYYCKCSPCRYTRNLVDKGNGKFNLMVLCWGEGHGSAIHDHANAHCVMKILQGELCETRYEWPLESASSGGTEESKEIREICRNVIGVNCICYINDSIGIHRVENCSTVNPAVSLHLYSPPFSTCSVFNKQTGQKSPCKVTFWSKYGERRDRELQESRMPEDN